MVGLHDVSADEPQECSNCGATKDLLRCSRCHAVWFCGVKCQKASLLKQIGAFRKAYWPFHKTECRRNEFADAVEDSEPKFASWMRKHGKLAVLKDDEVDRLERSTTATTGLSRQEVMDSMYGKLDPKPAEPKYTAEERICMRRLEEEEANRVRSTLSLPGGGVYQAIPINPELGVECSTYKWRQTQTHIEVFIPLPCPSDTITSSSSMSISAAANKVQVDLSPKHLKIVADERPLLSGELCREIKVDESSWYVTDDRILELVLLKRSRRGNYADGESNADTFWKCLLEGQGEGERLILEHPPKSYYSSYWEDGREKEEKRRRRIMPRGKKRIEGDGGGGDGQKAISFG